MGFSVKRQGYSKATQLLTAVANDMASNGFEVIYLNGTAGAGTPTDETQSVCLKATTTVDPLAADEDQPWIVFMQAKSQVGDDGSGKLSYKFSDGHQNWLRVWVCTPTQIVENPDGTWRIAYKHYKDFFPFSTSGYGTREQTEKGAGFLGYDSLIRTHLTIKGGAGTSRDYTNGFFYCFNADDQNQEEGFVQRNKPNWGRVGDFAAHPLSYRLSISDHGIAFAMWGESYDSEGQNQAWFCTQRMVDKDNGSVIVDGKSPLFTVFSLEGNGDNNLNTANPSQVLYMVTREADVTTPTFPVSATVDTADSNRIINSVQQVAIGEDEKFIIHFPNGLNSQRYGYPHELDMIGYTSADAISHDNTIELTFYGEGAVREYAGLGANSTYNKGMRMVMQTSGNGID